MNHRENKKYANSSQIPIKQEHHPNGQGVPIKHRSCLKHQSKPMNEETGRLSTGRVSFAYASSNEGKIQLPSQSQLDLGEKKYRSAMFCKKKLKNFD